MGALERESKFIIRIFSLIDLYLEMSSGKLDMCPEFQGNV
jgi:hypothetical protein